MGAEAQPVSGISVALMRMLTHCIVRTVHAVALMCMCVEIKMHIDFDNIA